MFFFTVKTCLFALEEGSTYYVFFLLASPFLWMPLILHASPSLTVFIFLSQLQNKVCHSSCHDILCLCRIGVQDGMFEIRRLLVGDILLSPEYWRANYREFLFSGFDFGSLDNLNEETRSVLQDGSISSEAWGGGG